MLWLCTVHVMPRLDLATVATCKYLRQRRAPCWCLDPLSAGGPSPSRGGNAVTMSRLGQGTTGAALCRHHGLELISCLLPAVGVNLAWFTGGGLFSDCSTEHRKKRMG